MCDFCTMKEGLIEGSKELASSNVSLGVIEDCMKLELWLERFKDGTYKFESILNLMDEEDVAITSIPIKFCPVCGKELR